MIYHMNDEQFQILEELLSVIYIQLARNYDLLAIIGDKLGADVLSLSKEHENGRILAPDPWMINDSDD